MKTKKVSRTIEMGMLLALFSFAGVSCGNNSNAGQNNDMARQQTGAGNGNQTGNSNKNQTTNQSNNQVTTGVTQNGTGNNNGLGDAATGTEDIEDVYAYIEKNNKNATKEDWNNWMKKIVKIGGENADYKCLQKYKGNMSKEMKSFVELMAVEQTRPSFNEEGIQLTLGEILDRCIAIEDHIKMYGKGETYQVLYPKYRQLMCMAVTGGYDGIDVVTNQYLSEDKKHIQTNALEEYKRLIKSYPNTETADILEEYLEELKENGDVVNQRIERFYEEIDDEFELTLTFFERQSL